MIRTTIDLNDRDLEQIKQIQEWHIKNHGIKLTRTQILKKSLYNENYFLQNEYHPEEINKFISLLDLKTEQLELPFS